MTEKSEKARQPQQPQIAGMFDEAMRSYEQTVKVGLKMQEEAGKWWTQMFNQATSSRDWQRRITKMADDVIPTTQKGMVDSLKLLEQNSRTGVDLLKKAMEATQTTSLTESQERWIDFWQTSMRSMRSNAQVINELNGRAIDSWIDFMWKNGEASVPKAAKTA